MHTAILEFARAIMTAEGTALRELPRCGCLIDCEPSSEGRVGCREVFRWFSGRWRSEVCRSVGIGFSSLLYPMAFGFDFHWD